MLGAPTTICSASCQRPPPAERRQVARLHRVAGICGQGARRGRTEPGFAHQPPLRRPRSHAGVRARVPARRADRRRRSRRARRDELLRRIEQRHPARRRQRARRGAERSVPDVVLELERAQHGDRARALVERGGRRPGRIRPMVRWLLQAREERPLGQHAGKRAARSRRSSPTTASTRRSVPEFTATVVARPRRRCCATASRADRPTAVTREIPMRDLPRACRAGQRQRRAVREARRRDALLHGAPAICRRSRWCTSGSTAALSITRTYAPFVEGDGGVQRRRRSRRAISCASRCDSRLTKERRYVARHRSAAGRLRAGRVVVRDNRVATWRARRIASEASRD